MTQDLDLLAASMASAAVRNVGKVRGVLGQGADDIRDTAQELARSKGWSASTVDGIYARSGRRSRDPAGYVFARGPAAYQETGTSRHPANPTLAPALDRHADSIVDAVADAVVDGLV